MLSFKPTFSLSSFTFIKRLLSSSSLSAIRVVSSAYLRLLIFLPAILIPACVSSSPVFLMTAFTIPQCPGELPQGMGIDRQLAEPELPLQGGSHSFPIAHRVFHAGGGGADVMLVNGGHDLEAPVAGRFQHDGPVDTALLRYIHDHVPV